MAENKDHLWQVAEEAPERIEDLVKAGAHPLGLDVGTSKVVVSRKSGKEIQYWSSIMLLRLGGTTDPVSFDPAAVSKAPPAETDEAKARRVNRELIAGEFHKDALSRRGKLEDERKQARRDLYRARSLRAAYYFGHAGEPEDRVWLGSQPDPGTDVLALRPDWEYPMACGHKGDDGQDHAG